MQRQPHDHEGKFVDEEIVRNRFLPINPTIEQETRLAKSSPYV